MRKFLRELFQEVVGVVLGWILFGIGVVLMIIGAFGGGTFFYFAGIVMMALGGYLVASNM